MFPNRGTKEFKEHALLLSNEIEVKTRGKAAVKY